MLQEFEVKFTPKGSSVEVEEPNSAGTGRMLSMNN